jgi:hypothetical protein
LDVANPKERTKRLIFFLTGMDDGYARYMQEAGLVEPGAAPAGAPAAGGAAAGPDQQAILDIQTLEQGQEPTPPQDVTPEYVQTIMQYVQGGSLDQATPEAQQAFANYVQTLKQVAGGGEGATAPEAPAPPVGVQ